MLFLITLKTTAEVVDGSNCSIILHESYFVQLRVIVVFVEETEQDGQRTETVCKQSRSDLNVLRDRQRIFV